MKRLLFLSLYFCCCTLFSKGQGLNEFSYVDNAPNIPKAKTYSSDSIAGYIQTNFKADIEKLHAIYAWVTSNIRYDTDSMFPINWSLEQPAKIAATLRRRKGVCENYASLFTDIAVKCGFPAYVVTGYTRDQAAVNKTGHSWSAVCLQGEWFLCDPTWDINNSGNTRYFMVSPAEFIETHIPFDPLWQLLAYPVMENDFNRGFFHSPEKRPPFNFKDSVKAFFQSDSLQQLEASARRMRQAGLENKHQKDWLAYNQMKIASIYGEKDMNLYNSAVADLNKANGIFNGFVQYRNNLFMPAKTDVEISSLLNPITGLLSAASKKLDAMGKGTENFQYDPGPVKERLARLSGRVQEQQGFIKAYLATNTTERQKLFYR